ncbi:MAG: hypothetical protein ACOZQL_03310 [Myxococcota bacterium]
MFRRVALFLLLAACHHERASGGVASLSGLTVALEPSPALRLVARGAVEDVPAEITFDPAQPVTLVTSKCVDAPPLVAQVSVPDPFGPDETFPLARVSGISLGAVRLRPIEAALAAGKTCVVVLGAPELRGLALAVNPATRELSFRPSQPRERWVAEAEASEDDVQVLPVSREPRFDWPLLTVRVRQGPQRFDGAFLLSLRDSRSRIYDEAARSAGLKPGLELLEGLPLPEGLTLPPELAQLRGFAWDSFELAPGFGLERGSLELEPGRPPHAVQGMLGADVWGRFHAIFDTGSDVLILRRPRVFTSGARARCARAGETTDEACFELHGRVEDGGVEVTTTVWRPLASGARVSLDLSGAAGTCRVGLTFAPGDRGRSTQHRFPWPRLGESVPGCGPAAFASVTDVTPGLLEDDGPLAECPGICAWAKDAASGRLSCECQPGARSADGAAERTLLELFKQALERLQKEREREPEDPP